MNRLLSRALFAALLASAAPAVAQAPALLPVQGYLTDDEGTPRDGEITVDLAIYTSASGGDLLHSESQVLDADTGYFATEVGLGDLLDLAIFRDNSELWLEMTVDGETLEPRLSFGTTAYAAFAQYAGDAQTVGGATLEDLSEAPTWDEIVGIPEDIADGDDVGALDWADLTGIPEDIADGDDVSDISGLQLRVDGTCAAGSSIRAIAADGTVTCEEDTDTDTTYDAGEGLALSGGLFSVDLAAIQARVAATCPEGSSIRAIAADGTVTCEEDTDTDTTYTAGAGMTLTGTEFSVDAGAVQNRVTGACAAGSAIRTIAADGTVTCENDDDTTYTAGSGMTLSGSTFSVNTASVQSRVSGTCPAGSSIRAIAANGTVTCEADTDTDTDTTYSAGPGLTLSGTTFGVNSAIVQSRVAGTCAAGSSIRAIAADGTVTCEPDDGGTYSAGAGLTLSGSSFSIGNNSVTPAMTQFGTNVSLPLFPNAPTTSCTGSPVGGSTFGSTGSTINQYVANTFYNEGNSDTGMRTNFTRARLQVTCRGAGTFELVSSCSTVLADITCSSGSRPWTATSEEFNPATASWNLRVRATSGSVEWANPQVILY